MSEKKAATKTKTDIAKPASDSSTSSGSDSSTSSGSDSSTSSGSDSSTSSSSDSGASASKSSASQNKSASALSTSHFSSVRSDEYRAGWQDIFGGENSKSRKKASAAKPLPNGPVRIVLGNEDLPASLLRELEAVLRKKAKKDKVKLGRKSKSQQLHWRLTGEISG